MKNITEATSFVKREVDHHIHISNKLDRSGNAKAAAKHSSVATHFQDLERFVLLQENTIVELREKIALLEVNPTMSASKAPPSTSAIELTPEDLEGLPADVLAELNLSESDQQELQIVELMDAAGGTISIDVLLVRWFKQYQEVFKRRSLAAKLYRMAQKGRIYSVPKQKGVYSTQKPPPDIFKEGNPLPDGLISGDP